MRLPLHLIKDPSIPQAERNFLWVDFTLKTHITTAAFDIWLVMVVVALGDLNAINRSILGQLKLLIPMLQALIFQVCRRYPSIARLSIFLSIDLREAPLGLV